MPADPEKVLEEAKREALDLIDAHVDGCQDSDADYVKVYEPMLRGIDRLVQVARLVGRVEQAEWDRGLMSGCTCAECSNAGYNALRKERDRLLAELEKVND